MECGRAPWRWRTSERRGVCCAGAFAAWIIWPRQTWAARRWGALREACAVRGALCAAARADGFRTAFSNCPATASPQAAAATAPASNWAVRRLMSTRAPPALMSTRNPPAATRDRATGATGSGTATTSWTVPASSPQNASGSTVARAAFSSTPPPGPNGTSSSTGPNQSRGKCTTLSVSPGLRPPRSLRLFPVSTVCRTFFSRDEEAS